MRIHFELSVAVLKFKVAQKIEIGMEVVWVSFVLHLSSELTVDFFVRFCQQMMTQGKSMELVFI